MSTPDVSGWSCDERNRKECRNGHGCHCREITALCAQAQAHSPAGITVEDLAAALYAAAHKNLKNCWKWDDAGLDAEHPSSRGYWRKVAKGLLEGHAVIALPEDKRRCQKCGEPTNCEEAYVDGQIWCHPCADAPPLPPQSRDGATR